LRKNTGGAIHYYSRSSAPAVKVGSDGIGLTSFLEALAASMGARYLDRAAQGLTKGAVDVQTEVGRAGTIGVAWNRALEELRTHHAPEAKYP
jgi:hypothetical protein